MPIEYVVKMCIARSMESLVCYSRRNGQYCVQYTFRWCTLLSSGICSRAVLQLLHDADVCCRYIIRNMWWQSWWYCGSRAQWYCPFSSRDQGSRVGHESSLVRGAGSRILLGRISQVDWSIGWLIDWLIVTPWLLSQGSNRSHMMNVIEMKIKRRGKKTLKAREEKRGSGTRREK